MSDKICSLELWQQYSNADIKTQDVVIECPNCGEVLADVVDVIFALHPTCSQCGEFATKIVAVKARNA